MKWLARLFPTEQRTTETSTQDLHRAAAALLMEVARTDGKVDEQEERLLVQAVKRHWQLDQTEMDDIVAELRERVEAATDLFEFTLPLRERWDPETRVRLIYDMWAIAAADGKADVHEEQLIRRVSDLLYVSHGDYIRGKLAALGEQ
ncbi:TerB family tellurite resistance protein [Alloalcanivorax gelatiniphagus]|uniref:TerB family tellurite resistance protein n=1 Tax=Alloalcanivorax gelatiniphagus TaxID=1194167 RepID=A0ABY2XLZ2_9GAMM|nr:TerB family tellurite resistance protein [Alloalcanivorax gelatiniphagus]TMW13316.1 TerB family tellurite resistance protein [Alloalcanivorax gelatiniphagus]